MHEPGDPLPDGWHWIALKEILAVNDSGVWGPEDTASGARILRSTNFRDDGTLDLTGAAIRSVAPAQRVAARLEPGDILLERSGKAGRVCWFEGDGTEYLFGNFCQRLRSDPAACFQPFLFHFLHLFHISGETEHYRRGSTIQNLQYKRYVQIPIPLPPLAEQHRIVAALETRLAAAERARRAALSQLSALEAMSAALLRRVFERDATI